MLEWPWGSTAQYLSGQVLSRCPSPRRRVALAAVDLARAQHYSPLHNKLLPPLPGEGGLFFRVNDLNNLS